MFRKLLATATAICCMAGLYASELATSEEVSREGPLQSAEIKDYTGNTYLMEVACEQDYYDWWRYSLYSVGDNQLPVPIIGMLPTYTETTKYPVEL